MDQPPVDHHRVAPQHPEMRLDTREHLLDRARDSVVLIGPLLIADVDPFRLRARLRVIAGDVTAAEPVQPATVRLATCAGPRPLFSAGSIAIASQILPGDARE